jgi:hypothetical protein
MIQSASQSSVRKFAILPELAGRAMRAEGASANYVRKDISA